MGKDKDFAKEVFEYAITDLEDKTPKEIEEGIYELYKHINTYVMDSRFGKE